MPTARLYKTEAIVLRQRRLGEADRILMLFTPGYGKLDAKAKGVRKTTSRMSGHLQPLTRCVVQLAQGRASDVITGCQTLESFQGVREDLERLSRALYAAELVDRFAPERVPAVMTYRLLLDTLRRLEAGPGDGGTGRGGSRTAPTGEDMAHGAQQAAPLHGERNEADMALRYFEMQLVDQSGFRPQLDRCVGCGLALEPRENCFSPQSGGALCPQCAMGTAGTRALSLNALKVMRLMQRRSFVDVARVAAPASLMQEIERHLRSYIVCVLERDVNSAAFIERLRREQALAVEV